MTVEDVPSGYDPPSTRCSLGKHMTLYKWLDIGPAESQRWTDFLCWPPDHELCAGNDKTYNLLEFNIIYVV